MLMLATGPLLFDDLLWQLCATWCANRSMSPKADIVRNVSFHFYGKEQRLWGLHQLKFMSFNFVKKSKKKPEFLVESERGKHGGR